MAAPMHVFQIPEPTYCQLKHAINPSFEAKLENLKNTFAALMLSQTQHKKILSEFKFLQVMIYKRTGQLRREKSIQLLKRVQACMKRVHIFDKLFRVGSDLYKDIQSALADMTGKGSSYLPAQQTWSYFLYLQLQYIELLEKTVTYCVVAFEHLSCQLATGILIPQMLVFMGITARIWMLSKSLADNMRSLYHEVRPVKENVERTPSDWNDPELPFKVQYTANGKSNTELEMRLSSDASKIQGKIRRMEEGENEELGGNENTVLSTSMEEDLGMAVKRTEIFASPVVTRRKRKRDMSDSQIRRKKKKKQISKDQAASNGAADLRALPEGKTFTDPLVSLTKATKKKKWKGRLKAVKQPRAGSEKAVNKEKKKKAFEPEVMGVGSDTAGPDTQPSVGKIKKKRKKKVTLLAQDENQMHVPKSVSEKTIQKPISKKKKAKLKDFSGKQRHFVQGMMQSSGRKGHTDTAVKGKGKEKRKKKMKQGVNFH